LAAGAAPAADDAVTGSQEDSGAGPQPGMLGAEGVVPKDGGPSDDDVAMRTGGPIEPIGHVPGPDEGVYGDPPNTGGTVNPETRGWAYDEGYFFALTRGLGSDTDLSPVGRRWVRPWTLVFDVATLPTAALAGLSGKAPAQDEDPAAESDMDGSSGGSTDVDAGQTPGSDAGGSSEG
jgi:hypothetical protein